MGFFFFYLISILLWLLTLQGPEDLKHSLICTTLELEATIASAKEEITRRECELVHVNDLLSRVIKERDEAHAKCQKLMLEKLELQKELQQKQQQQLVQNHQQHQRDTTISQNEDELQGGISEKHASSDCEENSMPSPGGGGSSAPNPTLLQVALELAEKKPLPEKGKLLKAVVEAGPLLQTLLLAGPLPQWQHPPPQLKSIEIPPVVISSPTSSLLPPQDCNQSFSFSKKRDLVLSSGTDCPISKCRKVIQHLPTTPTTVSPQSLPHPSFSWCFICKAKQMRMKQVGSVHQLNLVFISTNHDLLLYAANCNRDSIVSIWCFTNLILLCTYKVKWGLNSHKNVEN